jgi:hypothetical protein
MSHSHRTSISYYVTKLTHLLTCHVEVLNIFFGHSSHNNAMHHRIFWGNFHDKNQFLSPKWTHLKFFFLRWKKYTMLQVGAYSRYHVPQLVNVK